MIARVLGAVALLAAGCAAQPAAAPILPAPPVASAPAPPPETTDDATRYRPPLLDPVAPWTPPQVVEERLPSGARILVVERHELPVVDIDIHLQREERAPKPGLDELLVETLLESPAPGGALSTREALGALGVQTAFNWNPDSLTLHLLAPASSSGEAVAIVARAMARFRPDEQALARARLILADAMQPAEESRVAASRTRLSLAIDEQLAPRGHRYRDASPTSADLTRIKLADVARRALEALSPGRLRIGAAGDVTAAALRAALEPVTRGWKVRAARSQPPPSLARGVVLVDRPNEPVGLAIVWPALPLASAGEPAWTVARAAMHATMLERVQKEIEGIEDVLQFTTARRSLDVEFVLVSLRPGDVAKAARLVLETLDQAAKGELPDAAIEQARLGHLQHLEVGLASNLDVSLHVAFLAAGDLPPDTMTRRYQSWARATHAEVRAAARARIDRKQMRLVAVGPVASARDELRALGLGTITVVRPATKAARKP